MHIGLLGHLQVLDEDERDVEVSGAKLRALLARLALDVGRPVASDVLVDELWGEEPPAGVRNSLQGLVSKLRRVLGSAELVSMRGTGYVLELAPEAVDVHRYERLVDAGRAAAREPSVTKAIALLTEAEGLWRGAALADFAYDDWAAPEIARLTELRLSVIEERLQLELDSGRHHALIVDLEALVATHPLREGLRGLLMVALYRAGRQADALRVFREGREMLAEELGLDPGTELRRLESAILAQDGSLDAPVAMASTQHEGRLRPSIPAPITRLIGREPELRELELLLMENRLVTLVGPGGVGKTSLALEAARKQSAGFADGACLVELAAVGDPVAVRAAIASALDLPDPGRLSEAIGDRELLLLLDNCEHVITTAAEAAEDLLGRCRNLRLVATSREGLRVTGEVIWPVPTLGSDDAVELFIARARAAGAQELLTGEDSRAVIEEICDRLDGLPLAVELAAARTRAFPLEQVALRLSDRFRLLTGGARTALPRQQTLRAVVDWSYELLFADEQRVFERVSVFPGGCDLTTAETVCSDDELAADEVGDILQALVEKSLVIAAPATGEMRYTQLQTLAQYGREKLAERGDAERVRDAMASHFADLCRESASAYMGDRQRSWLMQIEREGDNLRAALEWAVANDDAETALAIAGGASWPHWLGATGHEGRRWLQQAFACGGDAEELTLALALTGRGLLDFQRGFDDKVDADLEAAIAIADRCGSVPARLLAQSFYAEVANVRGDVDEARRRRVAALQYYATLPSDTFVQAATAFGEGKVALLDGDLMAAERHYRQATARFATIDRPFMYSTCLDTVSEFDERAGDQAAAIARLEEAIATDASLGLRGLTSSMLARLGWLRLHASQVAAAATAYAEALDLARWLRHDPVRFVALAGIAAIERFEGRDHAAAAAATDALALYNAGRPRRFRNRIDPDQEAHIAAATCCSVLACIAASNGRDERCAELLGHADRLRGDTAGPPFIADDAAQARERALLALGDAAFVTAYERGRNGRPGEVIDSS